MMENRTSLIDQLSDRLSEQSQRTTQTHTVFLKNRAASLEVITAVVSHQLMSYMPEGKVYPVKKEKSLFNLADLKEFATGSLAKVFGPDYAIFDQRRSPRIPNGDLLLFSRVTHLGGIPGHFDRTTSITTEYDVPLDAWFLTQNNYPTLPFSILQELSLQPCGFLSAWLGTSFLQPDQDLYFRNLDGQATLLWEPDVRGKQITAKAHLLSTTVGGGTIIQKFKFTLSIEGKLFFQGQSVFGYFQASAMQNQIGMDNGKPNPAPAVLPGDPILHYPKTDPVKPHYQLPTGHLDLLHGTPIGAKILGETNKEITMNTAINPSDWFYACHFYQDPVMPGSLGVEAIFQMLQAFALDTIPAQHFISPRFCLIPGSPVAWKYRGQITQNTRQMSIKVDLKPVQILPGQVIILGDASLWADQVRIYEINNAGIKLTESV
ncbi:MAG TPA: hypothetical protein VF326_05245 [Anaerolineaceae bacterium]